MGIDRSLDTDQVIWAMLTKRNTPGSNSKLSLAEIVLGRKLSDALPILHKDKIFVNKKHVNPMWPNIWSQHEEA